MDNNTRNVLVNLIEALLIIGIIACIAMCTAGAL